jgi:hypothetical protein
MKVIVFWDVAPCSLIVLMMEAVRASETSVYFYQTTLCSIPEDCHLQIKIIDCYWQPP